MKSNMDEKKWTESICEKLKTEYLGNNINVELRRKIPYAFEIKSFFEDWSIDEIDKNPFETDLIIYENKNGKIIPRVIIESKYKKATSHDAITYNHKANIHKNVMPYVRYGFMIGKYKEKTLSGRMFRHGTNFDFLFCFLEDIPSEREWEIFTEMIRKEIKYSKEFEEIIYTSRKPDRKRYFMMQKEMHLVEAEDNLNYRK